MRALKIFAVLALAVACKQSGEKAESSPSVTAGASNIDIQGAGATFPYPLYSKWVSEYQKLDPRVRINYQSIGSGGGIKQVTEKTVDFGATDAPMKPDELAKAPGIVHIPTTLGAVVIAYNLPGFATRLQLTPDVLAGIYLGEITKWNDPKIQAANLGGTFPDLAITVAYRSDGSGTTSVFTEYLAAVSPAWKEKVGAGKSVKFPAGLGAKGHEGVAGQVKTAPGTIGYVELAYAKQTGLTYAAVQNQAGQSIEPTIDSITAAAAGVILSESLTASIVNAPGEKAYPIAAYTYILVYEDSPNPTKAKAIAQFLFWATHDGQKFGPDLQYAPLPVDTVQKVEAKLKTLKASGQNLL